MADQNKLMQLAQYAEEYGTPLMRRGNEYHPYEYMQSTDPLAASRMGLDMMRNLGFGNPLGVFPGVVGIGSDVYGAFDPQYQDRVTGTTRRWLQDAQRMDNSRDVQNQPGGFYGRR